MGVRPYDAVEEPVHAGALPLEQAAERFGIAGSTPSDQIQLIVSPHEADRRARKDRPLSHAGIVLQRAPKVTGFSGLC